MDTVFHGEESYQKQFYHLFWNILLHFCNTFYCYYLKYMRAVDGKSTLAVFPLYKAQTYKPSLA